MRFVFVLLFLLSSAMIGIVESLPEHGDNLLSQWFVLLFAWLLMLVAFMVRALEFSRNFRLSAKVLTVLSVTAAFVSLILGILSEYQNFELMAMAIFAVIIGGMAAGMVNNHKYGKIPFLASIGINSLLTTMVLVMTVV